MVIYCSIFITQAPGIILYRQKTAPTVENKPISRNVFFLNIFFALVFAPSLLPKKYTMVEGTESDKYHSLLLHGINYDSKSFIVKE